MNKTIKEIIEVRARSSQANAYSAALSSLSHLQKLYKGRTSVPVEFLNYLPVSIISCLEAFFRLSIKEIIDSGDIYLERATKLSSSIKFDFATIKALQGKHVSIGEFIAHSVPLGSIENINLHFSTLLEIDFLKSLRTVGDRWEHEIMGEPNHPILDDPNKVFSNVTEALRIRHIICHELPSPNEIKTSQIEECFEGTALFIRATNELISVTLNPNAPLTQTGMNIQSGQELQATFVDLDAINKSLIDTLKGKQVAQFVKSHELWKHGAEAWAEFAADYYAGGSIRPLIYATTLKALVRNRIDVTNDHIDEWKDR